jgi:hypothetical protein
MRQHMVTQKPVEISRSECAQDQADDAEANDDAGSQFQRQGRLALYRPRRRDLVIGDIRAKLGGRSLADRFASAGSPHPRQLCQ